MDISKILNLDVRSSENKEVLRKALYKLKPFRKYKDTDVNVKLSDLEKLIGLYCRKYQVEIEKIETTYIKEEVNMYKAILKRTDKCNKIGTIYACSVYELLAKISLMFNYAISELDIPKREV